MYKLPYNKSFCITWCCSNHWCWWLSTHFQNLQYAKTEITKV